MSQLGALVWLKWRLFRNSMRSRKAATSRIASALATLAALLFSLTIAAGLGIGSYVISSAKVQQDPEFARLAGSVFALFLFAFFFIYMMWAIVPLGLEGGSRFEPRRLLLYPISLKKLFAVDLLSELTNLSSIFAVPIVLAICVGAGLARGALMHSLILAALALLFGVVLSKLFSTFLGSLMTGRRTRGETLLALFGAAFGLSGVAIGQIMEHYAAHASRYEGVLRRMKWTPAGALASGLTGGLNDGGWGAYILALATLAAYTLLCVAVAYWFARRMALGVGGAKKSAAAKVEAKAGAYAGWKFPLMSPELSAVVEKELRYALRNAQLRGIALMAVALTVVMRLATSRGSLGEAMPGANPYTEGLQLSYGVLYVFLMISAVTTNLFGYDGAGMRSLVLAPVGRQTILVGKNIASTLVVLAMSLVSVAVNVAVFRDVTWRAMLVTALSFVTFAGFSSIGGNWFSLRWPKRIDFGRRMNRSGVAGLLLLPFTIVLAVPPAAAAFAGYATESVLFKYVILVVFALLSVIAYLVFIEAQARRLAESEIEIMEAVTGRDDDAGQVMG